MYIIWGLTKQYFNKILVIGKYNEDDHKVWIN